MTNKELYHAIIRSAVVYLLCAVICLIHIMDVYHTSVAQIREKQRELVAQAGELTQEYFAKQNELVKQSGTELIELPYDDAPSYGKILERLCCLGGFEKAMYIKGSGNMINTNVIYTEKGSISGADAVSLWEKLQEFGLTSIHVVQDVWELNDIYLMFPVKMQLQNSTRIGYVVGFYECTGLLQEEVYEKVNEDCQTYLITRDGLILDSSNHADVSVDTAGTGNFFTQLSMLSDSENKSMMRIQEMKANIRTDASQRIIITGADSHKNMVCSEKVDGAENIYIAAIMDQRSKMMEMRSYMQRTVNFMIAVMLMTLVPIIFIWFYSKGVTRRMEKLAYTDSVTQGKNINFFRKEAMNILDLHAESPYLIQRFDISNFRYINDAYGHLRADELLKACINIYQELYTDRELCVRMDSDQFLTLTINDAGVTERRQQYCEKVNAYAGEIGIKYPIRMKFGVYQRRKQDRDIDVMIDRANVARRSISGEDTTNVAYYSDAILLQMRKKDKIESEMQHALDTGEFKVYLQAKWDVKENRVAGAEALVRWIKPDGNIVYPDEFIPIFEQNGFIEKLDFYMLTVVCKRIQQLLQEGRTVYPVSINQSRILLNNPEYIAHVTKVLEQYAIPRKYIELEVTETTLFDDKDRMLYILNELKGEGIPLAMDDFGSGYSSLNVLKDMPFDILKIDREFFSESITSESSTLILQKIIEMAEGLGLEVICEGVETQQQVDLLKKIGCRMVQGYFYSRPIPMEEYISKYCDHAEGV